MAARFRTADAPSHATVARSASSLTHSGPNHSCSTALSMALARCLAWSRRVCFHVCKGAMVAGSTGELTGSARAPCPEGSAPSPLASLDGPVDTDTSPSTADRCGGREEALLGVDAEAPSAVSGSQPGGQKRCRTGPERAVATAAPGTGGAGGQQATPVPARDMGLYSAWARTATTPSATTSAAGVSSHSRSMRVGGLWVTRTTPDTSRLPWEAGAEPAADPPLGVPAADCTSTTSSNTDWR
mmetsp:Transcript_23179/g.87735  ORF Transcript_23179/g.87735 Transcript_23179/m.87735 type:complete len:242 (+) Transcript_23179:244-969(+)